MWYITNKYVPYLRKAMKIQDMDRETKMLYHWGATSIEIPSIGFLKPNKTLKWLLDSEYDCHYLEIEINKKEFIDVKWLTI